MKIESQLPTGKYKPMSESQLNDLIKNLRGENK